MTVRAIVSILTATPQRVALMDAFQSLDLNHSESMWNKIFLSYFENWGTFVPSCPNWLRNAFWVCSTSILLQILNCHFKIGDYFKSIFELWPRVSSDVVVRLCLSRELSPVVISSCVIFGLIRSGDVAKGACTAKTSIQTKTDYEIWT